MPEVESTSNESRDGLRSGKWVARAGWLLIVGSAMLVLALEPALSWFVVPALLVGVLVALVLRSSHAADSAHDEPRPEIQMAKIPVKGGMGLVFTMGTITIFCLALPEARWFLALAIPVGALIGLILHTWHKRHPIT
jgi:hypothetical protein